MQLNKTLLTMAMVAIGAYAVPISDENAVQNVDASKPAADQGYEGLTQHGDAVPKRLIDEKGLGDEKSALTESQGDGAGFRQ